MSKARDLAEEHWKYVEGILNLYNEDKDTISKLKYHYIETFIHGMKHGFDDRIVLTDFEDKRDKLLDEIDEK